MIELLTIAIRGAVFPLARSISVICIGKYLLFTSGSCVTHKYVHHAGKLQKFSVKPDVIYIYTKQRALKLG